VPPGIITSRSALEEAKQSVGSKGNAPPTARLEFHRYCDCGALLWDVPTAALVPKYPRRVICHRCGKGVTPDGEKEGLHVRATV